MHRWLKLCIWAGPVGFGFFGLGLALFTPFFPPPSPMLEAGDIASVYRDNALGIRLGSILMMFGASLFGPFFAAVSAFMRRMERGDENPLALTQAINATVVVAFFFLGGLLIAITAYRPDRAPELTLLMNDLSWIIFILSAPPAVFQNLAIGFAILSDPDRLLKRWMGYLTLWTAVIFVPVILGVLFKSGPFAWNGLFSFWIGAGIVGVWANLLAFQMLGAIKSGRWDKARAG